MADVFISYAREDRPFAARLAHALEAGGRTVWWDREILPGKDFAELIAAELAQAKAVVVIWSPASGKSGWVRDEAHEGAGARRARAGAGRGGRAADRLPLDPCGRPHRLGGRRASGARRRGLAIDRLRTGVPVPRPAGARADRAAARRTWLRRAAAAASWRWPPSPRRPGAAALADRVARQSRPAAGARHGGDGAGAAVSRLPGLPGDDARCRPGSSPWVPRGSIAIRSRTSGRGSRSPSTRPVRDRAHGGHLRAVAGLRRRRRLRRPGAGRCGLGPRQPAGDRRRLERGAGLCRLAAAADRQALPAAERGRVGVCLPRRHHDRLSVRRRDRARAGQLWPQPRRHARGGELPAQPVGPLRPERQCLGVGRGRLERRPFRPPGRRRGAHRRPRPAGARDQGRLLGRPRPARALRQPQRRGRHPPRERDRLSGGAAADD